MAVGVRWFIEELKRRKVINTAGFYLVSAFVAMQVVDAVFPYLPIPDPDAAGRLTLAVLVAGFPLALVASWIFEITPPNLKRERPPSTVAERPAEVTSRPLRPDTVAVLPFENLSDDPENQYFSDGITDDIISSVAQIRGLRVLSRTSVSLHKEAHRHVPDIARELGVATMVTGSVRRSGNRVRIMAEVIQATDGQQLWCHSYDRELEDIFEVQSDVAACIARAVRHELSTEDRRSIATRGTTDPEAYDHYLKARHLWNQRSEESVEESLTSFRLALDRDPAFALAHASLAEAYTVLGIYGARAPSDVLPLARRAAERALEIDQALGEAEATCACVEAVYDWNWGSAEERFRRATRLAPSYATAHQWYAVNLLTPQGRFAEAAAELGHASELDPGSLAIEISKGVVKFYERDYEAASRDFARTAEEHPDFALSHYFLGQARLFIGDEDRALRALADAVDRSQGSSETLAALAHAQASTGRTREAEANLQILRDRSTDRYVSRALLAQVLVGLGRVEEALDDLDAALEARATDLIWLNLRPQYDPIREGSRFRELVQHVGLSD